MSLLPPKEKANLETRSGVRNRFRMELINALVSMRSLASPFTYIASMVAACLWYLKAFGSASRPRNARFISILYTFLSWAQIFADFLLAFITELLPRTLHFPEPLPFSFRRVSSVPPSWIPW